MALILSEEQKLLKDSATEFLAMNAPIEQFRELRDDNMKICDILTDVSEEADSQRQYATSNLVQSITGSPSSAT